MKLIEKIKKYSGVYMNSIPSVYDASLIQFPKILDPRGNLTFIEQQQHIPFDISRVYWIYDVPGGEKRGGHAFQEQDEVIIALSGSFDVFLDDGTAQKIVHLNRAYHGLYVPKMLWRRMQNFSTNAVAYVLASCPYKAEDYVRNFDAYKTLMREGK
ncbi:sugar 3,4-ketoisomerase [Desulfocicer vacuolatum]|nr:FdtA/QdtA family cupin domain-containing protein [Desulfocicer vacuolatum]